MPECPPMATPKKPRRTAERILEVTLELFNRFGEPNVSTTLISAELDISPGNLYYHYPAKDELINSLFGRYELALNELLQAADGVENVEDAWLFFHMLFELIWSYRFLYRDLNDLLSKNRRLETHFQFVLKNKSRAVRALLDGLSRSGAVRISGEEAAPVATSMVVLLTYWLSYEYVREPRKALEPDSAAASMARGAYHVLSLLLPYLDPASRPHLHDAGGFVRPGLGLRRPGGAVSGLAAEALDQVVDVLLDQLLEFALHHRHHDHLHQPRQRHVDGAADLELQRGGFLASVIFQLPPTSALPTPFTGVHTTVPFLRSDTYFDA